HAWRPKSRKRSVSRNKPGTWPSAAASWWRRNTVSMRCLTNWTRSTGNICLVNERPGIHLAARTASVKHTSHWLFPLKNDETLQQTNRPRVCQREKFALTFHLSAGFSCGYLPRSKPGGPVEICNNFESEKQCHTKR